MVKLNDFFHQKSDRPSWKTPRCIFCHYARRFGPLTTDVCAEPWNAQCPHYYTSDDDGLSQHWQFGCWMNPPYRDIYPWIEKAVASSQRPDTWVVALLPMWTESRWYRDFTIKQRLVIRIPERFKFVPRHGNNPALAPFHCMVVVFGAANRSFSS